jgi:SPP1 family phage portal protein
MLSVSEIQKLIDSDITSEKKRFAAIGDRYYNAEHDIMKCRLFYYNADGVLTEDTTRSNIKICHPFFTELSDQLTSFMLSFDDSPIRAKDGAEGLQEQLDMYFDDEFWAEIGDLLSGAYNKGFEYLYAYKNAENRLAFQCADSMGVVEVREQDTDDGCKYIIYWYIDRIEKGKKEIRRIQVWSDKETTYFVQSGRGGKIEKDTSVLINPRPHVVFTDEKTGQKMGYGLGYIPFYRLDNCKKQFSGLKPIKALIDDYDMHACSLSNNLVDFDTPLHVVSGFQGDNLDELQQNLKTKKIVGVDAEGDVQVRTVDIPYQARKEKLDIDEKNIYRFGFGLNTIGLKDTSATTNIAIKAAYSLLEMKADKMEKRLRKLLKQIIKIVLAEINQENGTDYQPSDIRFEFQRSVMANETENIQNKRTEAETRQIEVNTILNVAANLDNETVVQSICDILDIDYEEIKGKLPNPNEAEDSLTAAMGVLDKTPAENATIFSENT